MAYFVSLSAKTTSGGPQDATKFHPATHPSAKLERKPSAQARDENCQGDDEQRAGPLAVLEGESGEEE